MTEPWHARSAEAALTALASSPSGLGADEAMRRLARDGPNRLPEAPPRPAWLGFVRQFKSPLVALLVLAAVLAAGLGNHGDAAVIVAVLLANAAIGSLHEGRAERSMAALRELSALRVRVLRDGAEVTLEAAALVAGDVLLLAAGDAVGADARLLEAAALQVAEAALTGESVPVAKATPALPEATTLADRHNMVFSGTLVTAGRARAVVVATGRHTEVGQIAGLTEGAVEPQTPLERRIAQFGRGLVGAALVLFAIVVLLGLWRDLPLAEVLMVAISQTVSMVPEGLPVAMTIALAVGMQRMAARGAVIRRLSAVETLGSTTVICSDKTGTLTRNRMTATALWLVPGRAVTVNGAGGRIELREGEQPLDPGDAALRELLRAAVLCNDAAPPAGEGAEATGDPTEAALVTLAAGCGVDVGALRRATPRETELPFDSERQLMATRHREPEAPRRVYLKGSPEAVLRLGARADAALHDAARHAAEAMAGDALRVLAFAVVDDDALGAGFDALAGRARLLGLIGEIDPPRDEAHAAVADCRRAGIRPVMVTGDHKLTGLAIARALGIARAGDRALDGNELERLGEAELRDSLDSIAVFARVQPAQKLRIVEALQARGEVVAMTGDGVNDAPALARADVGVAMGRSGTEVAKSAARIVIADDNFATIVAAVEQGRAVYANLKKVLLYLFATSADEVALLTLALAGGWPLPLAAVQILWINIVTEGTLTVNLVLDAPEGDEMVRPPVPRDEPLLDRASLARVGLMALTAVTLTFGWFTARLDAGADIDLVRSETFTLLAMCQWFNMLNCRSARRSAFTRGGTHNRWLAGGLALSVLLQLAVLYLPVLSSLFHTRPLPAPTLALLLALASATLWIEELRKAVVRRRRAAE